MTTNRAWVVVFVFLVLLGTLVYDAHVENRGLRQLVFGWLGDTLVDMRWQECRDAKKAICN
jgi:hypothetical protein